MLRNRLNLTAGYVIKSQVTALEPDAGKGLVRLREMEGFRVPTGYEEIKYS